MAFSKDDKDGGRERKGREAYCCWLFGVAICVTRGDLKQDRTARP